jgi:alkylhydroperoxidase family enzyme
MRITLEQTDGSLMTGPGDLYAKEIAGAGNAFAYAIYEHSTLPLRVFEAARIATAMINGCKVCMNWQSKRDVHQMGIAGGVTSNGEAPDDAFYSNLLSNNLEGFSARELIAVKFAKAMGTEPKQLAKDEKFWAEVKDIFTDAEITDLTYCIAGWMGMGRVAHVLGLDNNCTI